MYLPFNHLQWYKMNTETTRSISMLIAQAETLAAIVLNLQHRIGKGKNYPRILSVGGLSVVL